MCRSLTPGALALPGSSPRPVQSPRSINDSSRSGVFQEMIRPLIAAVFPLLAASSLAVAQRSDTLELSLPNAISIALDRADEVRLSRATAEIADAQVGVARASALPQLRVN